MRIERVERVYLDAGEAERVAQWVRAVRRRRQWTQAESAQRVGVPLAVITWIERMYYTEQAVYPMHALRALAELEQLSLPRLYARLGLKA